MDKLTYQKEIVDRITISYEQNKLFHSYIFSGEVNSGQLEVVNYMAKLLGCDIQSITTDKQNISKEQIVAMTYELSTSSIFGKTKLFVIEEAQKLSISAQNSLLKILEDNNYYVVFIVENSNQLLSTIISRSIVINFKPLSFNLLYQFYNSSYEDKKSLKYSLYLDSKQFESIYESEEIKVYPVVVEGIVSHYFKNNGNILYLLQEICYNYFSKKDELIKLTRLLIINVSSLINKVYDQGEIFDDNLSNYAIEENEEKLVCLLNRLFQCHTMLLSNVNPKLAFDTIAMEMNYDG